MAREHERQVIRDLLEGTTRREIHAMGIEALRRWRRNNPTRMEIQMHGGLGLEIVPLLAERKNYAFTSSITAQNLKEPFRYDQADAWMQDVVEFAWWLVRAGLGTAPAAPPPPT